jgi:hypothetical protein
MDFNDLLLYWGYIPVFFAAVFMASYQVDLNLVGLVTMGGVFWAELT